MIAKADWGEPVNAASDAEVVLCINSGSSSLKFAIFLVAPDTERAAATGAVQGIGSPQGEVWVREEAAAPRKETGAFSDHARALESALSLLEHVKSPTPTVAGHRVVHGGLRLVDPARVDKELLDVLRSLVPLAPLHLPSAIAGIEAVSERRPDLPQVACFDTAFHAPMPEVARRLPLPDPFYDQGVRRYGFHGLSYEYVMSVLGSQPPARIVIAHLGSGASLVAVKNGKAIDTTMGLTPAGGILMASRSGDLDPGVLVYLAREHGLSPDAIDRLVNEESGLTAVGGTSDMRTLLERAAADARARLAVTMFSYSVKKAIGGFVAALGGIDLLVFTGGIGERAATVRTEACAGLEPLGVCLDEKRNGRNADVISSDASRCTVRVVVTDEDRMIARHAARLARS
jgi:acetate kinase